MRVQFFSVILIAGLRAFAGDCSTVDFREKLGPPRDQADSGWCFANSAADMLSMETGRRVSAADIASQYLLGNVDDLKNSTDPKISEYLRENPNAVEDIVKSREEETSALSHKKILTTDGLLGAGGMDDGAILMANLKGLCDEEKLPSGDKELTSLLNHVQKSYGKAKKRKPFDPRCDAPEEPLGSVTDQNAQVAARVYLDEVNNRCVPRAKSEKTFIPDAKYAAKDIKDYYKKIKSGELKADRVHQQMVAEMDRVLDSGKVPSIGYNSYDIATLDKDENPRDGDHSSIIAGRKMIGGTCNYFVRNSYGKDCDYKKQYSKGCDKNAGGVWVPAKALKTVYCVISIK